MVTTMQIAITSLTAITTKNGSAIRPQIRISNPIPRYMKKSLIFIFNLIRLDNTLKYVRFGKCRKIHFFANIQKQHLVSAPRRNIQCGQHYHQMDDMQEISRQFSSDANENYNCNNHQYAASVGIRNFLKITHLLHHTPVKKVEDDDPKCKVR